MVAGRKGRISWPFVGVVLLYLALTLALTYPVAWRLTDALAGYPEGDNTQAMWSSWWFKIASVDLRTSPESISLLYYPDGYEQPLITVTPYTDVSLLPLQLITSPVVAYNLGLLASYFLTAVFTYLFCHQLTGNRWAALAGGFVFAFSPTRTMHAAAGHFTQSTTYWVPLYAMLMVKQLQRPVLRDAVVCGVLLALSGLVSLMQTAYFVIPFTLAALIWGWWQYRNDSGLNLRVRYLAVTAGVAAAITAPFYLPFLWTKFFGNWDLLYRPGTVDYSADLLAFFTPSPYNPLFSRLPIQPFLEQVLSGFPFEDLVYVGWVPLALAWYARREKTASLWIGLAVVTGVLSLGPLLKVGGDLVTYTVENFSTYIPLPYLLIKQLPLYDMGRTPARLTESVMLAVAALVALGLDRLLRDRRTAVARATLAIGILAFIAFEYVTVWPMPMTAAPVPPFYQQISQDGQDYAILDVPVLNRQVIGDAMYYQTIHRHPIVSGYLWRIPASGMDLMAFMESVAASRHGPDIGTVAGGPTPFEYLARSNIRYVTLHTGHLSARVEQDYRQEFALAWGDPVYEDSQLAIYSLPASPEGLGGMPFISAGDGWYAAEDWEGTATRWLGQQGSLLIWQPAGGVARLRFTASPYLRPRQVQVYVGGQLIDEYVINGWQQALTRAFPLHEGLNEVQFVVPGGCDNPMFVEGLQDDRCLTIAVQNVELVP